MSTKTNKVSRKLNDGEAFDSGMYCCQLYFNMNRGYAVAKNAVCGLYNDDGQATILQDETTGQYYIWAYYVLQINHLHFHISSLRQKL